MNRMLNSIFKEVVHLRKQRNTCFQFSIPTNWLAVLRLYIFEFFGLTQHADNFLIDLVVDDLVRNKVILKNGVSLQKYSLGDYIYYDVSIRTFDNQTYARGVSLDRADAFGKALGEVWERFFLKHYKQYPQESKSILNFNECVLPYADYPHPTVRQLNTFPDIEIHDTDSFASVNLLELKTQCKKYISLQAITLNPDLCKGEKLLLAGTSNGAAGGYTLDMAKDAALLEIIQRHGFFYVWFNKLVSQKIKLSSLYHSDCWQLVNLLQLRGFTLHLLDLTAHTQVPTVVCVLERLGGWYVGAATKFSLDQAISRAIDEAMSVFLYQTRQNYLGLNHFTKEDLQNIGNSFVDKTATMQKKVYAFSNSYFLSSFDKFFLSGQEIEYYRKDLDAVFPKQPIEAISGPVFEFVFSHPMLDSHGYSVVKYFAPHMHSFFIDDHLFRPVLRGGSEPVFGEISPFP